MDVRAYFQKVRAVEAGIAEDYVVVVSCETSDGGVAGKLTEVSRSNAARLIVDGKARLGTAEETEAFRTEAALAREAATRHALAEKVHVTVISDRDGAEFKMRQKPALKER